MQILAACTQSKRGPIALCLGDFLADNRPFSAGEWRAAIDTAPERLPLRRLYKGGYWKAVQDLRKDSGAAVHVVSAGLGLLSDEQVAPPYNATFASGDANSVPDANSVEGRRRWWMTLGGSDALRAVSDSLIVVLPTSYLAVVLPDLLARGAGRDWVFTTVPTRLGGLEASAIPVNARMAAKLGVNVTGLLPAAARFAMRRASDRTTAVDALHSLVDDPAARFYPKRTKLADGDVALWIRSALAGESPPSSASAALVKFRDAGFALEQKRFHRVFAAVVDGSHG